MKTAVSLIVVHWNTPELLSKQLAVYSQISFAQVIVVDNASDKKLASLQKQYPKVVFIENDKNLGFATACNQGAERATSDWLLFLNPDVMFTSEYLSEFTEYAEMNSLDAISPEPEKSQQTKYRQFLPSTWNLVVEFSPLRCMLTQTGSVQTLTGGCLLIKRRVLEAIDGWDEDFFLWFEDSDLTKRLVDGGYAVGWFPKAVAHLGGQSVSKLDESQQKTLFFRSMSLYSKKHFSFFGRCVIKLLVFWNRL